jgi:hypothetical protein
MSIGAALRDAREAADTSIEEAAWRTRIRPDYLRALESDCFDDLGEAVFVRGHLHSYARFLRLDPSGILRAYDDEFETGNSLRQLYRRDRTAKRPQRPRWLLAAILAAAVLVAVSAVGLIHGPGQKPVGQLSLPVLPPRLEQPPQASRNNPVVEARSLPAPLTISLAVAGRCWIEVVSDGKVIASEVLADGATREFTSNKTMKITLGNAGAAKLTFNNVSVPIDATGVWTGSFGPNGLIS